MKMNDPKMSEGIPDLEFQQLGISNTEVVQASKCERAWLFGYHPATKLSPKSAGPALTRGIIGHNVLEMYYKRMQDGERHEDAVHDAMEILDKEAIKAFHEMDSDKHDILRHLEQLMLAYFDHYKADIENWEILEVETFHMLEWENEYSIYLPMRLDMTVYMKRGKFAGEICPVDHKFTNDFWNSYKMRLNSQLPLYIRALRQAKFAGHPDTVIKRSIVNQIRTRKKNDAYPHDLFKRSYIEADDQAMEKIFDNHRKRALRVAEMKRLPFAEAYQESMADWGSTNCDFCFFKSLCAIDLEGGNTAMTIAAEYKKSDYGYPSMEELLNER